MDRRTFFHATGGAAAIAVGSFVTETSVAAAGLQTMTPEKDAAITQVSQTVVRFFDRLDLLNRRLALGATDAAAESDNPWELMTPDGEWRRNGSVIGSQQAFSAAMGGLAKGLITSHQVVNLLVDAIDEQQADVRFSLTIYSGVLKGGAFPAPLSGPGAILVVRAQLTPTGAGWRIRQMVSDRIFLG